MHIKRQIVVLVLYIGLVLLMTAPVISTLTTQVAGTGGDPWQAMWRFESEWRAFQAAQQARNILPWVRDTFLGGGEARLVNISVWPWMGLHVIFGEPMAYNVVLLLSYVLSGYFMYLLVKYLTSRSQDRNFLSRLAPGWGAVLAESPAFLAGVLYMFLPFHVAHSLGHFGAMQTQWLPLAILLLFLWVKRPTVWRTIGLAFVITLQSWSEHHYLLWLAVFVIIFAIFRFFKHSRGVRNDSWGVAERGSETVNHPEGVSKFHPRGGIVVLLCILLFLFAVLPWLPTVRLAAAGSGLNLGDEQTIRFSADLFSFITPPPWQPIWGGAAKTLFSKYFTGNVVEATEFLGFLPLLLFIFFRNSIPRKQKIFWVSVALVFFAVSLGPQLHAFGKILPIPLPYKILQPVPVFSAVRAVARAGVMVGLSLSILFGWVLARELRRPISAAIILAGILIEFLFLPFPSESTKLSAAYDQVRSLPGTTIVEVPAATNYIVASEALYASLRHGKEVVGDIALERAQESGALDEIKSLPGLRQLLFLRTDHLLEDRADFFEQDLRETLPDVMKYLDASAITVRQGSLSATQREAAKHLLEEQLGWEGKKYDDVVLYRVEPRPSDGVFLARSKDWQAVGFDQKKNSTFGEIPRPAAVTIYNVRPEPAFVTLEFTVEQGSVRVESMIGNAGETMRVPVAVRPGKTRVIFESLLPGKAIVKNPKMIVSNL